MKYYVTSTYEIYKAEEKDSENVLISNYYKEKWQPVGTYTKKAIADAIKEKMLTQINKAKALKALNINSKQKLSKQI